MNSPAAITYPDLPPSVIADLAWTKGRVRTRASSNVSVGSPGTELEFAL